jgi:hypothetical protein
MIYRKRRIFSYKINVEQQATTVDSVALFVYHPVLKMEAVRSSETSLNSYQI